MSEPAGSGDLLDDSVLVARATSGDQHAFGALFDRHIEPVYWQAYQVVGDPDDAQDIAQETFVTAWRRLGDISIVDRSALPWLLVTARFTALNASRKRGRLRSVHLENELADSHETPSEQVEAAMVREAIAAAVARLSPLDQQLFTKCIDGELTYEQAASELGVTHGAVRNRVSRLRARLRGDLRPINTQDGE
ncbi:MAG TPA: sigma-70 family RNA polymerase sigma factor [Aeromicrobium sp.]|nr:sigma-70 family RNA polymerase sigma factor [Aeromicrobium sp.]